ncbi:hypothetical protein KP78_02760 [Jeotgalibacillus soli]|uniref:DUF1641 domain-containing protein n=1 Tax=Jeotgalibacillus soli TaxID=889306 RepID=A0A0C2W5P9_9BACL|nr:hypothetical protein KP78_02760 [Jeotgalibacillus soli]
MAKATKVIHRIEFSEEEQRQRDLRNIENTLLEHKEVIEETFGILKHMQDRGVLNLLNGLFAQGDKVLDILVKTADTPETANSLKNLLLMLGTLGTLNVQQLEPVILKMNTGIARVAELGEKEEKAGYRTLLRSLNDPEIKRAMAVGVAFLKGLGEKQDDLERTTQNPEDQAAQLYVGMEGSDITASKKTSRSSSSSKEESSGAGWMIAAAGITLLSIPLSRFLKK